MWVTDFWQRLCLFSVAVETVVGHYDLLPLGYCQWIGLQWLVWGSMEVMIVVHAIVLPAILEN